MKKRTTIVDLFCGGGGETSGIMQACGRAGLAVELHAVNHWERAVETHSANFPWANHYCAGVETLDPCRTVPGGKVDLLWASPECTHHSTARGGRPKSDQSRASAWTVLKWLQELSVRRVIIENVPEFVQWGPLNASGEVMAARRGETFAAWVNALRSLGYRVEWRVLNAADYGAPTTRRRLFVQAVRGSARLVWPEPSHAEDQTTLFADSRRPWRAAAEVIDWSVQGQRLSERARPLAAATLRRIETGIRRYWGAWAEPFIMALDNQSSADRARSVAEPLSTVVTKARHCLVEPFVVRYNGTRERDFRRVHGIGSPLPVVDCSNRYGLVEPFVLGQQSGAAPRPTREPLPTVATDGAISVVSPFLAILRGQSETRSADRPAPTVSCSGAHLGLVVPYYGNDESGGVDRPLRTVTCKDRFGLLEGEVLTLDIRFRMLLPHELAGAQGFPREYAFHGTREEQVRQIGNAVCPPVAEALAMAALTEVAS